MDYMIFNVRTDVNAYDCTQECTDTVRESALTFDVDFFFFFNKLYHKVS